MSAQTDKETTEDGTTYRAFDLTGASPPQAYQLITRVVGPRPIALVSSLDDEGRGNLAPFSYFMMGGSNPPSCIICPVNDRHGRLKDTVLNIEQTGEYVISICTRAIAEAMNQCSYSYDRGVDELERAGLTRLASTHVAPPRVAESPVHLECRLHQILRHGTGGLASNYIVGEIVCVHVRAELLDEADLPDDARIDFIGRLGGSYYTQVSPESLFELERPAKP